METGTRGKETRLRQTHIRQVLARHPRSRLVGFILLWIALTTNQPAMTTRHQPATNNNQPASQQPANRNKPTKHRRALTISDGVSSSPQAPVTSASDQSANQLESEPWQRQQRTTHQPPGLTSTLDPALWV
jgi:hypothetical protein